MPAMGVSWRFVNVSPSSFEAMTASSKNISKKSPNRNRSRVSRARPRRTSKYCCIIGVSLTASDMGRWREEVNDETGEIHEKIYALCGAAFRVFGEWRGDT